MNSIDIVFDQGEGQEFDRAIEHLRAEGVPTTGHVRFVTKTKGSVGERPIVLMEIEGVVLHPDGTDAPFKIGEVVTLQLLQATVAALVSRYG